MLLYLLGKSCQRVPPRVFSSLYGKAPQNKQHQDQKRLRLHSFLYYNKKKRQRQCLHRSHGSHQAVAYSGFNTMKRLGPAS